MGLLNKVLIKLHIKKRPPHNMPGERAKLPPDAAALLSDNGLNCDNLVLFCKSDMNRDGDFRDTYVLLDEKGLYIADITADVLPKKGKKHLAAKLTLNSLESIPADEIDSMKTERYLATGELIYTRGGEDYPVTVFSIGLIGQFEELAKVFNAIKEKRDYSELIASMPESTCKKCGCPVPPGKAYCKKCDGKSGTFVRLLKFFSAHKGKLVFIIAFMLGSTGISLILPQISTKTLFDDVLSSTATGTYETLVSALGSVVITIVAIKLVNQVFTLIYQYIIAGMLPWVIYDIKVRIFSAMQRLSVGFFTHKQTGSLMERVTRDSNNVYWFFIDGFPYLITSVITVAGIVVIMFATSAKLTVAVLAAAAIIGVLYPLFSRVFRNLHHKVWVQNSVLSSKVSDNVNGHRIIKAFSKENEELKSFSEVSGRLRNAEIKYSDTEATVFPVLSIFIYAVGGLIIALGGIFVVSGEGLTTGELLAFIVYLQMLEGPIEFLSWAFNWWARCADSAQRIFEIIDTEPDVVEKENPVVLPEIHGDVDIKELRFEYEPARPIIKNLSLSVKAGQMLGIVGKTGAGKTTISNLIARLYDAKEGSVMIDGIDVRDLSLHQLRTSIGIVSQDIFLFTGTIADNIRYARPEAPMNDVIAAAKAASAHDFIMKLPDGYETRVGSGGQDLSGGERQRVSIARTIIQDPRILILDEATAAMDTQTEQKIQNALTALRGGRTTLAIAHRLSTLRDADVLAVIDEGRVTEFGTYRELMEKKGEYFKLYKMQADALKFIGVDAPDDTVRE